MTNDGAEGTWLRGILVRALIYGCALGLAALAGAELPLSVTGGDPRGAPAVIATLLASLAIGLWVAGMPQGPGSRDGQRWLQAGAALAVAGAFSVFLGTYRQLLPGPWWLPLSLLIGVAIPGYVLGLLPLTLLGFAEQYSHEDDHVLQPLPALVLCILGGATIGVVLGGSILPITSAGTVLIIAAVLLVVPTVLPEPPGSRPPEHILYDTATPFGRLIVTELEYPGERQPERRLYLNGEEESGELVRSGAPTLGYIAAAERWLGANTPPESRYLFLGGGAYTLPRRIAERDPRADIVVVELDPEVTRVAQLFFGLKSSHGIRTVHADARAFLDRAAAGPYDRIFVDVYSGGESLPYSLVTQEAAQAMRSNLTSDGIAALNLIGTSVGDERLRLWSIVGTYATVFPETALYVHLGRDFPDRQNFLLLCRMEGPRAFPTSTGGFELWPKEEWPEVEGRMVFRDFVTEGAGTPQSAARQAPLRERMG